MLQFQQLTIFLSKSSRSFLNKKILQIEVTKMWKLKIKAIPVVTGALGMIMKGMQSLIDQIPGKP